jgi:hypothetical protein
VTLVTFHFLSWPGLRAVLYHTLVSAACWNTKRGTILAPGSSSVLWQQNVRGYETTVRQEYFDLHEPCVTCMTMACSMTLLVGLLRFQSNLKVTSTQGTYHIVLRRCGLALLLKIKSWEIKPSKELNVEDKRQHLIVKNQPKPGTGDSCL